ncbi:YiiX/YebB-like N1pC/P60 family cysteine hydrolase [Kaarinaea lacus]
MMKLLPTRAQWPWMLMNAGLAWLLLFVGASGLAPATATQIQPNYVPFARIVSDQKAVLQYRAGMQAIIQYMGSEPELFPPNKLTEKRLPTLKQKQQIRSTWKSLLDYALALDSIGQLYENFYLSSDAAYRKHALTTLFGAYVAQYRFALEYIHRIENDPGLDIVLNEAVDDVAVAQGAYDKFQFRFLNIIRGTEFVALNSMYSLLDSDKSLPVHMAIEQDVKRIWQFGAGRGELLTFNNALDIIRNTSTTAWFPVQAGVAEWMGDTKVVRVNESLISTEQIHDIRPLLQPADVLLERREWYLSNIGLPGYWPHAAIYIGTADERRKFFASDEVNAWVKSKGEQSGDFEALLKSHYPESYASSQLTTEDNHQTRVIEAISEGVSFTSLEHSADADSVAVLRPNLSPIEKAMAIYKAFAFHGRPYDFNFDFLTDSALVCTELVYKSFEPGKQFKGLVLPTTEVVGRKVTTANDIARLFDEEYGAPNAQFELVMFLDGLEKQRKAQRASVAEFRRSWRRPKWHILVQD